MPLAETNSWSIDVDARTFEKEVIQRSRDLPVIVDFWATWCGPCKTLGPALEKRARDGNGRFVLAKVDIDKNPELAQAFRVQAVPTVLAIVGGKLLDGFQGGLPDTDLDRFLDTVAPTGPLDPLKEIQELVAAGDLETALAAVRALLEDEPENEKARLCEVDVLSKLGSLEEANASFGKLAPAAQESLDARAAKARLALLAQKSTKVDLDSLQEAVARSPGDVAARVALGRALVASERHGEGLEQLLEGVRLEPEKKNSEAKTAMLEVFDALGLESPVANEYRFKMSLVLFS